MIMARSLLKFTLKKKIIKSDERKELWTKKDNNKKTS